MRGSASTDFLHGYALAIVIIIAAIGALAYIGVFSRSSCIINGGFTCTTDVHPDGVTLHVTNKLGVDANVIINMSSCGGPQAVSGIKDGETREAAFSCTIATAFYSDMIISYNKSNETRRTFMTYGKVRGTIAQD